MWNKTDKREYDFIVNPGARSGMGRAVWDRLRPELLKRRINFRVYLTEKKKHAQQIASAITQDRKEHMIVVLGGDGTVNEVINGIADLSRIILGYIPIGSSNDFARGLKISHDPGKALSCILNPSRIISMDIGEIQNKNRKRRFAVSAGIGIDAAVCHEVCVSRWKPVLNRIGLGKLIYAAVALDRLHKDRPVSMTFILPDGAKRVFHNSYFAAFMNLRYEGGGFKFSPQASAQDGMLDVVIVHDASALKLLCMFPAAFAGLHVFSKSVSFLRCRSVCMETEQSLAIHTDGEPEFPRSQIAVHIISEKLRVIIG